MGAFVKVETIEGTNMYRLFEHVTVGIQLKGSEAHAHILNLSLWRKLPGKGKWTGRQKETNSTSCELPGKNKRKGRRKQKWKSRRRTWKREGGRGRKSMSMISF